jgi:hypothetical protein
MRKITKRCIIFPLFCIRNKGKSVGDAVLR